MQLILQVVVLILCAGGTLVGALAFEASVWKWIWVGSFGFFTIAALILTIITYEKTPTAQEIAFQLKGGDSFCYFRLEITDPKKIKGPFQLWQDGNGVVHEVNYWISPASAKRNAKTKAYSSLDKRKKLVPICFPGGHAWDRTLPLGNFYVEFDAGNGKHWLEYLQIYVVNGELRQYVKITDQQQDDPIFEFGTPP